MTEGVNSTHVHDGPATPRSEVEANASPAPPDRSDVHEQASSRLVSVLERYGLVWVLLGLVSFFSLWPQTSPVFTSVGNLRNLVASQAVIVIAAMGALIVFTARQFDISGGAVLITASVVVAGVTTTTTLPLAIGLSVGVLLGAVVGLINGAIVAYLRGEPIIITLGVAVLLGGLVRLYTGARSIIGIPSELTSLGSSLWLGVPAPVWLMAATVAGVGFLLRYTVSGRQLLMIGSNRAAADLVGVRTRYKILVAFALEGSLYGLAGTLYLARTGAANPVEGFGFTMGALTAVFLGATTIRPGRFNVVGTVVGVFFIAVSVNGLTLAGVADWVDPVFTGSALVVAVAASTVLARHRTVS